MLRAGVIGTGAEPDNPSDDGFAMGYQHAQAYEALDDIEVVACADLVRENAEAFAEEFNIDPGNVFSDYRSLLSGVSPDIASITVPPAAHAEIAVACAESGQVDAIHCEKPMAQTWGGAKDMLTAAQENDVQLTFNHQRRFGTVFREAKELVENGAIGDLERIVYTWGDFFDNGTHCIDMCNYFNDQSSPEWVIGGLDYREKDVRFGAHSENQMFAQWRYENGVYGMASTGEGRSAFPGDWYVVGSEGTMTVHLVEGHRILLRKHDSSLEERTFERNRDWITAAIEDVVDALRYDRPSELRAENAIQAMEIIFGGYQSARKSGRIELPPSDFTDNPLEGMIEENRVVPKEKLEQADSLA